MAETAEENKAKLFTASAGVKDETEHRRLIPFLVPEKTLSRSVFRPSEAALSAKKTPVEMRCSRKEN